MNGASSMPPDQRDQPDDLSGGGWRTRRLVRLRCTMQERRRHFKQAVLESNQVLEGGALWLAMQTLTQ